MNAVVTNYIVNQLLGSNEKKYPATTQSIGIDYWHWRQYFFLIKYWCCLLQYFCVLVLVIAIKFIGIVNYPVYGHISTYLCINNSAFL